MHSSQHVSANRLMTMVKIGITGGIGCGKSFVCKMFGELGYPIYNCDNEAKRLMMESREIRQSLSDLIGENAYIGNTPNKQVIAEYLFASKCNAQRINRIVHPVVKKDFLEWANKQDSNIVIQECAILFEAGFEDTVDKTIEVFAPEETRLQRAMSRDKATETQIRARMAQQMPEKEKLEKADFTIVNDGDADLKTQIEKILSIINN